MARQVRPATETLTEKKLNLQGRVLRREFEHPLRQVTFRTGNDATRATPLLIKEQGCQKVIDYTGTTKTWSRCDSDIPEASRNQNCDDDNADMNEIICSYAYVYKKPFQGNQKLQKAKHTKLIGESSRRCFTRSEHPVGSLRLMAAACYRLWFANRNHSEDIVSQSPCNLAGVFPLLRRMLLHRALQSCRSFLLCVSPLF